MWTTNACLCYMVAASSLFTPVTEAIMKFTTLLFSLSTAAAVEVDAMSALANVAVMLDSMYTPLETTASTIKTFVEAGSGPITSPTSAQAGMVSGTPKGDLANALFASYEDVGTNGLWIAYNDSSILGYWNINGLDTRTTQIMYRPGDSSHSACTRHYYVVHLCSLLTVADTRCVVQVDRLPARP